MWFWQTLSATITPYFKAVQSTTDITGQTVPQTQQNLLSMSFGPTAGSEDPEPGRTKDGPEWTVADTLIRQVCVLALRVLDFSHSQTDVSYPQILFYSFKIIISCCVREPCRFIPEPNRTLLLLSASLPTWLRLTPAAGSVFFLRSGCVR
ncbi:hypothetical protein CHARACLAT_031899 [Characodon lateralis]|uniref:Uncharacterized protein n=1 Tax=Characodon lateralis TaxID=208331 RepID=A0ABU7EP50_9TELE|nr:hypothetical protein [Characodon lateralis]